LAADANQPLAAAHDGQPLAAAHASQPLTAANRIELGSTRALIPRGVLATSTRALYQAAASQQL
jgi:hypothetical protein